MTNMPPSDPRSSERSPLSFDEFIGILVAFTTIGAILFWSFSRRDSGFNLSRLPLPSSTISPSSTPPPLVPPIGAGNLQLPQNVPPLAIAEPPETASIPSRVTIAPVLPPIIPVFPISPQVQVPAPPVVGTVIGEVPLVSPSAKKSIIPPPIAFTDVPENFWANRFIDVLSSRRIIEGYKDYSFRPNQAVDRAEFAAILQKAFDKELAKNDLTFKDVASNYWATPAIDKSIKTGFLKGYPDQTFKPEQKIPRVQVLVALVSGLNLKSPASPEKVIGIYKDAKDIPKYALTRIAAATANGLVVNYPDKNVLAPNKEATRAEVTAMVHQALVQTGRLQPIKSDNIVQVPR
jgi:S-layer homology domain